MSESIRKAPGRNAVIVGWVFIALAGLSLFSTLYLPHTRDPAIEALLHRPSRIAVAGTMGVLLGRNIFAVLSIILGLYAALRHRHPGGTWVVLCAIMISFPMCARQFQPSETHKQFMLSETHTCAPVSRQTFFASHDQCEFTVVFPHQTKTREVTVAGFRSYLVETEGVLSPYLRAEFMPVPNVAVVADSLEEKLASFAHMAGLTIPEFTVADTDMGKKGTYSGTKTAGPHEMRIYGILVLGDHSMIHCMIVEPLQEFPSPDTLLFIESIRRRRANFNAQLLFSVGRECSDTPRGV